MEINKFLLLHLVGFLHYFTYSYGAISDPSVGGLRSGLRSSQLVQEIRKWPQTSFALKTCARGCNVIHIYIICCNCIEKDIRGYSTEFYETLYVSRSLVGFGIARPVAKMHIVKFFLVISLCFISVI